MKKYLFAIKQILFSYPNTFLSKIKKIFKIVYWYFIITPFYKKDFIIKYLWDIKMIWNKKMDGHKYSFLLPTIDFWIKFLEYEYLLKWDTFIDIWANIWNHALIWALKWANVHAFEPNTEIINYLNRNLLINNFYKNNIKTNDYLVWDKNENVKFYQYSNKQSGISSFIKPNDLSKINEFDKKMVSLDEYIKNNNIKHVKILKIDVEWAEPFVFQWASNSLKDWIFDIIFWESNSILSINSKKNILEMLRNVEYENFEFTTSEKQIIPYKNWDNCLSILSNKVDIVKNILNKL